MSTKIIQLPEHPKLILKNDEVWSSKGTYIGAAEWEIIKHSTYIPHFTLKHSQNFIYVAHLSLDLPFQNKGIGTRILAYIKQQAIKEKLPIYLYTVELLGREDAYFDEKSKRRIHFYTKNGFTVIDEKFVDEGKTLLKLWKFTN